MVNLDNDYQQFRRSRKRLDIFKKLALVLFIVIAGLVGYFSFSLGLIYNDIDISDKPFWSKLSSLFTFSDKEKREFFDLNKDYPLPPEEDNRLDILILGIRGKDDPNGGLLTDSMILFSMDKTTNKSALISLPRDLYIDLPGQVKGRINILYEQKGLNKTKVLLSRVLGIRINHVVVLDFSAFDQIIDSLEGIDIYLDKPFEESAQWGYKFYLPAGENHLNGQTALYYVRSRYSSSDFDRSHRQQKIILAIGKKVGSLGLISDPLKIINFVNQLKNNIKMDIEVWNIKDLADLAKSISNQDIKKIVLDTNNLLYESHIDNNFVLLPKEDNFNAIRVFLKDLLN